MNDKERRELIEKKRIDSQLAILKATNELLEETKSNVLSKEIDDAEKLRLEEDFNKAIEENKLKAQTYLKKSVEDIEKASYKEVSQHYVDKYNERLKKKGITDEEMHRKSSAIVVGKKEKPTIARRKRLGSKRGEMTDTEEITRLDNEEELMRNTMVKDESDIEKRREKNLMEENKKIKEETDKVEKIKKNIVKTVEEKKVNTVADNEANRVEVKVVEEKNGMKNEKKRVSQHVDKKTDVKKVVKYDFNFDDIPSYVQYDILPLPSKGECYPIDSPLRCGKIPVAYLTASDENLIASPNMYRDGKLLDVILKRKVLDKRINTDELCTGDRDAIILWLRATSYGDDFPIVTTNPDTGKQYNVTISLSSLDYFDFNLVGDENGLFDYENSNGDIIKFKFFTKSEEEELRNRITQNAVDINKFEIMKSSKVISESIGSLNLEEEEVEMINEDLEEISTIVGKNFNDDIINEEVISTSVTDQMIMYTYSVNGNEDREFIRLYIENMRTMDSMNYRNYVIDNKPGVDFGLNIQIPESDGGGSFRTFLRIDDTIFLNF